MIIRGDQQISEEPLFQDLPRTVGERAEPNASAAALVAPYNLAAAVNVAFGFGKIEAKRNGPIHFEGFSRLNSEAFFMQVEQFTQVDGDARIRTIKTDINGRVEFLTKVAAPILSRCIAGIRQPSFGQCLFGRFSFGRCFFR